MMEMATLADKQRYESEMRWEDRAQFKTLYDYVSNTAKECGDAPALTFQLKSGPKDPHETLSWTQLLGKVRQTANMFRRLGINEDTTVAYLLPNANETVFAFLGGAIAGKVNPLNPTLSAEHIAGLLNETGAKVLVTLAPFPKSEVAQLADKALAMAPSVETVLEVDLLRYLTPPLKWIVPFLRPKLERTHKARVLNFTEEMAKENAGSLDWEEKKEDRVCAQFHTGGTTGIPKVAQHRYSGMIYNGWVSRGAVGCNRGDVCLCPLPMFHVFAAYPILMTIIEGGGHLVLPTPAGYRGDGVYDNYWKLVERWKVTFMTMVPTAAAQLMQRPVNADVSTLSFAICGSAPLPVELFNKFEAAAGVKILEGYGMTEATCMISVNPREGERKVGSVGLPFPYSEVRIIMGTDDGPKDCETDEVGEICVSSPGVIAGHTYMEEDKNRDLYYDQRFMRTGDLGRIDEDGYLWITGRAKDLIIRGGHNIDPAIIEEALAGHDAVAFAAAIGQPDEHAGEVPCAYVELRDGATTTSEELIAFVTERIAERAAIPKHMEIMKELPKTAVGKVFKPDLRRRAIRRVYDAALHDAGIDAAVAEVVEDKKRGLVAMVEADASLEEQIGHVLGNYIRPFEMK